jgi:RNA-binding protein YlmH
MNEQDLCKKRLLDLSRQADRKGIVLFSDFLNLNEMNIYHQCQSEFVTRTESYGGIPYAERQIIAFIPDALYYEWTYPIAVLKVEPAYPKFAEKLGHRDLLGSIMTLGIDRAKIGDILMGDGCYYILCEENVALYFMEQLTKVRHTLVHLSIADADEINFHQELIDKDGIITSNRLDAVIACVYRLSRSQSQELIHAERVFANGKIIQTPTYICKPDDIISVRGHGRFHFISISGETNKGRLKIKYQLYQS